MMIPRYVENNKAWAGKNHYSLDMLPPIEKQIAETKAAISGIDAWIKSNKTLTNAISYNQTKQA